MRKNLKDGGKSLGLLTQTITEDMAKLDDATFGSKAFNGQGYAVSCTDC